MCENKKNKDTCVEDGGKVFSGKKYCHNSKTCFCCAFDPYGSTPPPPYGSTISPYGSTDTPPYGSTFTSPYGSTYEPCPYQGCPTDFFLPFGYNQIFKLFMRRPVTGRQLSQNAKMQVLFWLNQLLKLSSFKRFLLTLCLAVLQGQANIWVGVRGDGEKFLWQSSQTEFNVSLLGNWQPGFSIASTGLCIAMRTDDNHIVYPNIYLRWPYDPYSCNQSNLYRLCEVPTTK
ncbi:unnamed protein product [Meganyctiphanes norvegica]|uniref:Uncharacterized protein n=1 Tax=Meganyctiphanes norvegica TaxID=48144 RepID=A0AAV2PXA0_MEGNR